MKPSAQSSIFQHATSNACSAADIFITKLPSGFRPELGDIADIDWSCHGRRSRGVALAVLKYVA